MPQNALIPPQRDEDDSAVIRNRSPHPYLRYGSSLARDGGVDVDVDVTVTPPPSDAPNAGTWSAEDRSESKAQSTATSDSGTEADDERPHLLRALPPAALRPRKGLRLLDGQDGTPLLTPSQLDREGKKIQGYFEGATAGLKRRRLEEEEVEAERQLWEKRRRAERIRRTCETALLGAVGFVVLGGPRVWTSVWEWHRELVGQVACVALLILAYPLRVVSSGPELGYLNIWKRFRVPASFDPASVLYPTFIPVLVALSLLPQFPALLLPNLILGLASLPPRLFPASSRMSDFNVLQWMISLVPLICSENTEWPSKRFPPRPYGLKAADPPFLDSEALTALYPLHQALLPPLHFLTTTSLLPPEKQLLSTSLVNLIFFAISPQAVLLKGVLWIGPLWVFGLCTHVLRWNVALARVPRWRLKHAAYRSSSTEDSLLNDVKALMAAALRGLLHSFRADEDPESDADEDGYEFQPKAAPPKLSKLSMGGLTRTNTAQEPRSAVEPTPNGDLSETAKQPRPSASQRRRHTIASADLPAALFGTSFTSNSARSTARKWYLTLTPAGAALRKWVWAGYTYFTLLFIIFIPVRAYIKQHALGSTEPILWALTYLLGDLKPYWHLYISGVSSPISILTTILTDLRTTAFNPPPLLPIPTFRATIGPSNTRLLLIAYWLSILTLGLLLVLSLSTRFEVDTRRKVFHGMMVLMLLPSTFLDPCFAALALALVLAVFLTLELLRAAQVPPLGSAIARFVAPYVDGRDLRGPVVVSHVFLLVGCAVPLWLSLTGFDRNLNTNGDGGGDSGGWELEQDKREVAMVSGVICVGMGDAAASLIGRRFGKRKWPWIGGKSLEGSAAFAAAVTLGLVFAKGWLGLGGWRDERGLGGEMAELGLKYWGLVVGKAVLAGCGASFMEAVLTGANDNVVVPVALWLLVRGVGL